MVAEANRIDSTEVGTVAALTLYGERDLSTQPSVADAVARLARPGAVMVVDLSAATFIDSTVLHALTCASDNADTLAVVAPSGKPGHRLLEISGLAACLTVCETTDEALRYLLGRAQPQDRDDAVGLLGLADHLLDLAWEAGADTTEPLALARRLSITVGREPLIEDAKLLIADAQRCTPSQAFERLVRLSQQRNEKLAVLARRLAEGVVFADRRR